MIRNALPKEDKTDMIQSGYDVMEVCLNEHQVSDMAASFPELRKPYCSACGEKTILACLECDVSIPGLYHVPGVLTTAQTPVPNNCSSCGTAYPWRQAAIASAMAAAQTLRRIILASC